MACGLQPAAAAALWPHLLSIPRRSDATKEHPYRVPCTDQFQRKLPLGAAESYRSMSLVRCTSSGSSAKAATLIRRANVSTAHNDLSMSCKCNSVNSHISLRRMDGNSSFIALFQRGCFTASITLVGSSASSKHSSVSSNSMVEITYYKYLLY